MSGAYRRAGVDLDAAADAVALIRDLADGAGRPEVVGSVGGFAGLFDLGDGRLLAAATDGVGTKADVARRAEVLDTIGIDLVAMSVNDVVCTGAEPLLFLDYVAVGQLVPEKVAALVGGVAEGCRRAGCALLGGETAEHPGTIMDPDGFDLAGFCVGIVDADGLLGPHGVREGDALVGLASAGVHANGFSLIRRLVDDHGVDVMATPDALQRPLVEELLEPTAIYADPLRALAREGLVRAAAHITGGGIPENLARALPEGLGAGIDRGAWVVPPVFGFLQELGDIPEQEMFATFNMGVGMIVVVPEATAALDVLRRRGHDAFPIGSVEAGERIRL